MSALEYFYSSIEPDRGMMGFNFSSCFMSLQPGTLVSLADRPGRTYQVVNLDEFSDCVWVRGWPLSSRHKPTFAVSSALVRPTLAATR